MFLTIHLHRTDSFLLCAFALKHITCVATHTTPHQQVRYTRPLSTCNGLTYLSTKRASDESNLHHLNPPLSGNFKRTEPSWWSLTHERESAQRLHLARTPMGRGGEGWARKTVCRCITALPVQQVIQDSWQLVPTNLVSANHIRLGIKLWLERKSAFWGRHLAAWNASGNCWEVWRDGSIGKPRSGSPNYHQITGFFPGTTLIAFTARSPQTKPNQIKSIQFIFHG